MSEVTFNSKVTIKDLIPLININLKIINFKIYLNENKCSDIRTRARDDLKIVIKINFQRSNDIIDIYYQYLYPVAVKSELWMYFKKYGSTVNHCIAKSEYGTSEAYMWKHLITLYQRDFFISPVRYDIKCNNNNLNLGFKFKVLASENVDGPLCNDLKYLLDNRLFSDVKIISVEHKEYKVHKAVLAARSAVLKAHFEHNTTESSTKIVETPFEYKVLEEILNFIYSDKAPNLNEIPEKLLVAADYYQLNTLKSLCEEALHKKLTVDNAIKTLQLADLYSAERLKKWTLIFIKAHAGLIKRTESWATITCVKLFKIMFEYVTMDDVNNEIKYYDVSSD